MKKLVSVLLCMAMIVCLLAGCASGGKETAQTTSTGEGYKIPWSDWQNMKTLFGRKYVKETDLQNYRVKTAWNGTLFLLD